MATEVAFSDLDSWLQAQPENTVDTPYELNVTGITLNDLNTYDVKAVLINNSTKFVDLRATTLPYVLYSLYRTFEDCVSLVYPPVFPETLVDGTMSMVFLGCTNLKETPVFPKNLSVLGSCFSGCTSLTVVRPLPDSYTEYGLNLDMACAFMDCTSLEDAPIIPEGVTNMLSAFRNCTSLTHKPILPSSVTTSTDCYTGVTTNNWKGTEEQVENYRATLDTLSQTHIGLEVLVYDTDRVTLIDYANWIPCLLNGTIQVLNTALSNLPANTVDTPHHICVTGFTDSNIESTASYLTSALTNNPTKYVDLYQTRLPEPTNVISMAFRDMFKNCVSLVISPRYVISNSYALFNDTYTGCTNLKKVVIDVEFSASSTVFNGCSSLGEVYFNKGVRTSPSMFINITSLKTYYALFVKNSLASAFKGCTALESVEIGTLSHTTDASSAFEGCTSLENVTIGTIETYSTISSLNLNYMFKDCVSLENFPDLDFTANAITMSGTFEGCTKLVESPDLPSNVTTIEGAFYNCTFLEEAPTIPSSVTNVDYTFYGCSKLTQAPTIPSGIQSMIATFRDSGITQAPTIPSGVIDLSDCFNGTHITQAPTIPNGVTTLYSCFIETDIVVAPSIPSSVTSMNYAFYGCTSLKTVPNVPSSVTTMEECFEGCSNLEVVERFEVPLSTITQDYHNCWQMFGGCTKLRQIGHKTEPSESWHVFSLSIGSSSVEGTVYGVNTNKQITTATIPSTSITKSSIRLPVLTDELWFPSGLQASEIEDVIEDMLNYKYGVFNKQVIPPDDKYLILWADEDENHRAKVITNIGGGGGGGATVVAYSASTSVTAIGDMRIFATASGITITLEYGTTEIGTLVEVYAVSNCTVTYYTGQGTTASLSMATGTKASFIYYNGWRFDGAYGAVWN